MELLFVFSLNLISSLILLCKHNKIKQNNIIAILAYKSTETALQGPIWFIHIYRIMIALGDVFAGKYMNMYRCFLRHAMTYIFPTHLPF